MEIVQTIMAVIQTIDILTLFTIVFYFFVPFVLLYARLYTHAFLAFLLFVVFFSAKIDYHFFEIGDVAWKWLVFNVGTGGLLLSLALNVQKFSSLNFKK